MIFLENSFLPGVDFAQRAGGGPAVSTPTPPPPRAGEQRGWPPPAPAGPGARSIGFIAAEQLAPCVCTRGVVLNQYQSTGVLNRCQLKGVEHSRKLCPHCTLRSQTSSRGANCSRLLCLPMSFPIFLCVAQGAARVAPTRAGGPWGSPPHPPASFLAP